MSARDKPVIVSSKRTAGTEVPQLCPPRCERGASIRTAYTGGESAPCLAPLVAVPILRRVCL